MPCNHNTTTSGAGRSHVIYSDDKGETWHLGGIMDVDYTNESTVTELSNGDLMLNMRKQSDTEKYRMVSTSTDGGLTWTSCKYTTLKEPICQGSILFYGRGDGKFYSVFCKGGGGQRGRKQYFQICTKV